MSSFVLTDRHLSVIANVVAQKATDIQAIADKLKAINIDSVNYRYDEKTRKTKVKLVDVSGHNFNSADLYSLINCWGYQSCNGESLDYRIMLAFLDERCKAAHIVKGETVEWAI